MHSPREIESIIADVEFMLAALNAGSVLEPHLQQLRQFYAKIKQFVGTTDLVELEAIEGEFYGMLELHRPLKKLYYEAIYAELAQSCSREIDKYIALGQKRPLTEQELNEKAAAEAALKKVDDNLRSVKIESC